MSARPWDAVAVKTRTPASEAAMEAAIAECSLSTVMRSPASSPRSARSASFSRTGACGGMGETGRSWGRARSAGAGGATTPIIGSAPTPGASVRSDRRDGSGLRLIERPQSDGLRPLAASGRRPAPPAATGGRGVSPRPDPPARRPTPPGSTPRTSCVGHHGEGAAWALAGAQAAALAVIERDHVLAVEPADRRVGAREQADVAAGAAPAPKAARRPGPRGGRVEPLERLGEPADALGGRPAEAPRTPGRREGV